MMNMNELAQKTPTELTKLASELRAQIREMRFKVSARQLAKIHTIRAAKRDLARIETAMHRHSTPTT